MSQPKPFALPTYWTADQALAVVDLLDDLREHLWAIYGVRLQTAYRDDRAAETDGPNDEEF